MDVLILGSLSAWVKLDLMMGKHRHCPHVTSSSTRIIQYIKTFHGFLQILNNQNTQRLFKCLV